MTRRERAAVQRFLQDREDTLEDEVDKCIRKFICDVRSSRYVARAPTNRSREGRWNLFLYDTTYLNGHEFLEHFRVSREVFHRIVELIRDDPIFDRTDKKQFRGGAELHLLILLKHLGSCGNDTTASKLGLFFGLGMGSICNYLRRIIGVILKLKATTITWPDSEERRQIAQRMNDNYGFVNCVGVVDGTLLPLEFKPPTNGDDYYTRKGGYAVNAMVTCDDVARIRDIIVGWPGSTHDNRVWANGRLNTQRHQYFAQNEYLLGGSAFQPSAIMVPAFKKPPWTQTRRISTNSCLQLASR